MEPDYIRLKEIKPDLAGYVRETQVLLKKSPVPDEETVHDIRVLLKKARAVLKLIDPQIDKEYADKDITSLKEAARIMSSWRDTSVQRKILKELRKEYPSLFAQLRENEKITSLLKKPVADIEISQQISLEVEQIDNLLKKAGYRIRFHSLDKVDPQLLLKSLEQTFTMVISVFLKCRNDPAATKLHEFRKKSKDFLYQLYFFRPLNNNVIKTLEKELDAMTRNLGKINDLSQLIKAIDYKYSADSDSPALDELVVRIREKQDKCLGRVWPVASRIFLPGKKLVNVLGYKLLVI